MCVCLCSVCVCVCVCVCVHVCVCVFQLKQDSNWLHLKFGHRAKKACPACIQVWEKRCKLADSARPTALSLRNFAVFLWDVLTDYAAQKVVRLTDTLWPERTSGSGHDADTLRTRCGQADPTRHPDAKLNKSIVYIEFHLFKTFTITLANGQE